MNAVADAGPNGGGARPSRIGRLIHQLEPRPLRRSIGTRILAGFGITAMLALAVAVVSLAYNMDAGRQLERVTRGDREASAALRDLEVAVEQQSSAVQNFLLSGDDRDLDALAAGRARFAAALGRLEQQLPPDMPRDGLEAIRAQAQAFDEIATEEIALYRQGWARSANFLWRTDGQATRARLLAAVQEQVAAHNWAVDAQIEQSRSHLAFSFGLSIALVVLGAALALMIGMAIARAVTGPVRNLVRVAAAVRGGDYTVRAPVDGDDELAALSATMNAMVESLQTSRTQLERALQETERSEERYRVLTDNANDIIFALDIDGVLTFVNPAVEHTLGYTPEEMIGRRVSSLFTAETRRKLGESTDWMNSEPRTYISDIEIIAKNDTVVPVEVNVSVVRQSGRIVGLQGIARDMTERHRMEQELRRLHEQDRRRVHQLIAVNEMGRKTAALQPVETLLPHLVRLLGSTFGYQHVRILLLDDEGELKTAAAWHTRIVEPDGHLEASPLVQRALRGDAGFVAGSGRPEDAVEVRYNEVAVPVRTKSDVLGVLDIRGGAGDGLDESDIFTLQTLADQIAVAIENARLYEAGQRLAVSEERNRLARELHDSVTQELFSMTMMAGALPALIERKPELARERSQRLHELARGALAEMRALLFALRPAALQEEGLIAALQKQAAAIEAREGIHVYLEADGGGRLAPPCEEALYRVFQEALNNVVKHAQARNVWVQLEIGEDETSLSIRDDGIGLQAAAQDHGLPTMGMTNMRERIEHLGGIFRAESLPEGGTEVRAVVPIGVSHTAPV
jgi:PAS domain S-box-containing protein